MTIYYADQNGSTIRLLQSSDYKKYKLSNFKSDEGNIKAIVNFPFFANGFVVGRYQGDVFDNRVDQTNFKGLNIVITEDNAYHIGEYNGWDYCDIKEVLAGFCPSAVLLKGKELEISDTIIEQKQWSKNSKINRTALIYDTEYHFAVGENVTVNTFLTELKAKYPNYEFIALGDSGGSSELIINGVIQNNLSDGEERANYCGLAFLSSSRTKKLFAPRYSKDGMRGNKYWYDKTWNAGANNGAYGDSALANCVTYASGRFSELNGQNLRDIMKNRTGFGNAKDWYSQTKLEKGSTAKVGAIACFDGALGHVAIVEKINDDGTVTVSQSNYEKIKNNYSGNNYFQVKTYKLIVGQVASGVGLTFLGYIYPTNVRYSVERNTAKDQVEILAERLKVRLTANGEWNKGIFAPLGIYDILETKTEGDYTWAKLDDDMWVALNDADGWTKTYLKNTVPNDNTSDDYKTKYEELEKAYNDLNSDYKALESDYKALSVENIEINKRLKQATMETETVKNDYSLLSDKLKKIKDIIG